MPEATSSSCGTGQAEQSQEIVEVVHLSHLATLCPGLEYGQVNRKCESLNKAFWQRDESYFRGTQSQVLVDLAAQVQHAKDAFKQPARHLD